MEQKDIFLRKGTQSVHMLAGMANRHGLIAGATGTGKTVSLQVLAEGFSRLGVPVFMADVKGDLSGLGQAGQASPKLMERLSRLGYPQPAFEGLPVTFWDVLGREGLSARATISEMGPLLLARLLGLNEVQTGVLNVLFRVADEEGLLLLDLKDLQAMLAYGGEHAREWTTRYGAISTASIGAIQRSLLALDVAGGTGLFGEPALEINDLLGRDDQGRGMVHLLDARHLVGTPALYSTFLLYVLSELFEQLPERGDQPLPRLIFFFDEAHLLFRNVPAALMDKIEQVVRLIRSKGVGVYFVTQHPADIPDPVLAQLGHRIQHGLRAYTPKEQKALRSAADSFRANPAVDTLSALQELAVGEALVSVLDAQGRPSPVERIFMVPPASRIGPMDDPLRRSLITQSPLHERYGRSEDPVSAYEMLRDRAERKMAQASPPPASVPEEDETPPRSHTVSGGRDVARTSSSERVVVTRKAPPPRSTLGEQVIRSVARSAGTSLGRHLVRGLLGVLLGGKNR